MLNQDVTEYIQGLSQGWQADVCTQLRQIIHDAIPDVAERLQYRKPHFLKNGKYACVLGTAKGWVSVTIFNAAPLEAPEGFFEPGPPERKTVKIREGQAVDADLFTRLLQQATQTL